MNNNKDELLKEFWELYDRYIAEENKGVQNAMRSKLSALLAQIEKPSRKEQLTRPEKGWQRPIAWEVLRSQEFFYGRSKTTFQLFTGEMLTWIPHWDRDVFLTRIPRDEIVSNLSILHPGYNVELTDKPEDMSDWDWDQCVKNTNIFADERGLYLPLYEVETVKRFCIRELNQRIEDVIVYLEKEL